MIETERASARVGGFALRDVSLMIPQGAWGIVLGPAGAGKTTLLETIAGVRRLASGRVMLRGMDVSHQPPEARGVGIVYQHGFLFPHLGVDDNVRYGARDGAYADEISARLGVTPLRGRDVRGLSGGERQLVAMARALAPRPDILLLDEPFTALDPRSRARARRAVHELQREQGITVLQVTHDFAEAGTLGDVAVVLENGRLVQMDEPARLFRKPASGAVAEFLGADNVYAGQIRRLVDSGSGSESLHFDGEGLALVGTGDVQEGSGHAVIRAEEVVISTSMPGPSSARNVLPGEVVEVLLDSMLARVTIRVGAASLVAAMTRGSAEALGLAAGVRVVASVKATAVHLC